MASTVSSSGDIHTPTATKQSSRLRGLGTHVRTLVSLLAVYAPPALVLQLHRSPIAKLYLVVGIWAVEGIAWYWLKSHVFDRQRHPGASWRPDCN